MARRSQESLESFCQLLQGRVFLNINYTEWLLDCIVHASLPIHVKFSVAIKELVTSTFLIESIDMIPQDTIQSFLNDCSSITPTHMLLMLYVLQYCDAQVAFKTDPKLASVTITAREGYSPEWLETLPIRLFLDHAAQDAYRELYPDFVSLAANLFPESFDAVSFLLHEGKVRDEEQAERRMTSLSIRRWMTRLNPALLSSVLLSWQENPDAAISALQQLGDAECVDMTVYADIVVSTLGPPCLLNTVPQNVMDAFISTWETLHRAAPHQLWVVTFNTFRDPARLDRNITFDELIKDPLLLFKCDPRLFRSTCLLSIWLHMLICLRICSKHRIWKRYHTVHLHSESMLNNRNVGALINAQDVVMLQLLLELCLARPGDEDTPDVLAAIRRQICRCIHGIFIDGDRDMLLAKILHFQTYTTELIPIAVDLIPSIYIVFNFIPELLRQPQPEKQVFGILMACYLCEKYPLEQYLAMAEKYVLPRLVKIAYPPGRDAQTTACEPSEYLEQAIPGFVHLARAFPHFGPQILQVYDDIARGLPAPKDFIGQGSNSKIILVLRLHKVLSDSRDLVQAEVDQKDKVNKLILQ